MITAQDIFRWLQPLKKKIMLLVGRCILTAINNSEGTQKIQIKGLKNETVTDIERFQEYGFETYPKKDSEALILFINGNRDSGIVACVHDRNYRPKDLSEGDVCVYDYRGLRITIDSTGITLKTDDATTWKPNILDVDPFTGLPHGGPTAGIVKLKGA